MDKMREAFEKAFDDAVNEHIIKKYIQFFRQVSADIWVSACAYQREKDDQLIKMLVSNFYWDQAEPEEVKTARELQKKYFPENFEEIS